MLEPPDLSPETIIAAVRAGYGIPVAALVFLPLGNDASSWVYSVQAADGATFFLKMRQGPPNEAGQFVPRYLRDNGVARVVAPLPTRMQNLWIGVGEFALILYPLIEGRTGMEIGLSERQWIDYGATLRQIHATALTPQLTRIVKRETFNPKWSGVIRELEAHIARRTFDDPIERELASFWQARCTEIRTLLDRAEALVRRLQPTPAALVLCHADCHTANVLVDTDGQLWIVDWDETVIAPKERDLMFVVRDVIGDPVVSREEELFFKGYGPTAVDPLALAYYRYEWAVQEIGDYGTRVFLMPGAGAETKRDALQRFLELFQPGDVVAAAYASDNAEA